MAAGATDPRVVQAIQAIHDACSGEDEGWDGWAKAWLSGDRAPKQAQSAYFGSIGYHRAASAIAGATDPRAFRANARASAAFLALAKKREDVELALVMTATTLGALTPAGGAKLKPKA